VPRGGRISGKPVTDVGKAVVCFQYVERVKSELIIGAKLLEFVIELRGDEQVGARRLLVLYLDALMGEINIANNVVGRHDFVQAGEKVMVARERVLHGGFEEAILLVSGAISSVASSGQWAMQVLKDNGFL